MKFLYNPMYSEYVYKFWVCLAGLSIFIRV